MIDRVRESFQQRFGAPPTLVVRAPGRVNLIGEHTDYNDGFVLPMAINRAAWIALRPRTDGRVVAHSLDFDDESTFDLGALGAPPRRGDERWVEYLKGVAWALGEAGQPLHGWDGVVAGDVPIGAGLSSSAALELAAARAFAALAGSPWDATAMARLAQRAENEWVGVQCGIMDQLISATGVAGHARLIDCRSLAGASVPLPPSSAIVVLDTATRRGLVGSAYNERRTQCEAAARFFGVAALRDVDPATFEARGGALDPLTRRRARHVISENARTLAAAEAMRRGDGEGLGQLMDESHRSLRDDFEVSSAALDTMVELAQATEGCLGARMTGAGFGGCAVALVRAERAAPFALRVAAAYQAAVGLTPSLYISQATDGASVVVGP